MTEKNACNHDGSNDVIKESLEHLDQDERDIDSADEALCEMLGMPLGIINDDVEDEADDNDVTSPTCFFEVGVPNLSHSSIDDILVRCEASHLYQSASVFMFPPEISVPPELIRRITNELVWGSEKYPSDRTFETIRVLKKRRPPSSVLNTTNNQGEGESSYAPSLPSSALDSYHHDVEERRVLTRLENFVNSHSVWDDLCRTYLRRCVSSLFGKEMVLFKEKLNLKPPGGSGFAPHLDTPSLRLAFSGGDLAQFEGGDGEEGKRPKTFVTVMVAIDDMTLRNGCLRVAKGSWSEEEHCEIIQPEIDGNPDAGGRAGAVPTLVAETQLDFEPLECPSGTIVAFGGWTPHRSAPNSSPFPRRAVFLTYNPAKEGDFHDRYYERMQCLRDRWKQGLRHQRDCDWQNDLSALDSVPRI